jgi:predicted transcriptional regulator
MPSMALSSSRVLGALAVAAVTLVVLSIATAAVESARNQPDLVVPPVHLGDSGTYDLTLEGDWFYGNRTPGVPFHFFDFVWDEPTNVRDGVGRSRPADVLRTSGVDYQPIFGLSGDDPWPESHRTYWLVPGEDRLLARGSVQSESGSQPAPTVSPLLPALGSFSSSWDSLAMVFTTGNETVCALASSTAGSIPTRDGLSWASCSLGGVLPSLGERSLKPVGRETIRDLPSVRLQSEDGRLQVWMAEGLPVPLRVQATLGPGGFPGLGDGRSATLDLTAFRPGDRPRAKIAGIGDPLPPLAMAPRTPWALEEAGATTEFPLQDAYTAALEDPDYDGLRVFLAQSPDAYLAWAVPFMVRVGAESSVSWSLIFSNGVSTLALDVTQTRQPGAAGQGVPLAYMLPPGLVPWTTTVTVEEEPSVVPASRFPTPDRVPDELPTVSSVLERWRAHAGPAYAGKEANAWGHWIACGSSCDTVQWFVTAGHFQLEADIQGMDPADPGLPTTAEFDADYSQLTMRSPTEALLFLQVVASQDYEALAAGDLLETTASADAAPTADTRVAGLIPGPVAGVSIGVVASLMGLLYLLWPALKGGSAFGLFSRLQAPALLEHETRALLLQVVQAEPGIHFQALVRRSGLANGTAVHHLRKLEEGGWVVGRSMGRYTCYFPGASPERSQLAQAPVTRSDGARRILAEIAANPGLSGQQIALRLGVQPSTVTYHVRRMLEVGLVQAERDGRVIRLRAIAA